MGGGGGVPHFEEKNRVNLNWLFLCFFLFRNLAFPLGRKQDIYRHGERRK